MYLAQILQKYEARSLINYSQQISQLKSTLRAWASGCYVNILDSGSRAKGTAISLASDVDFLVSLTSGCNENSGGLKSIYDSLYSELNSSYQNVRKQNVSVRISLNGLEIDVTPARKQNGLTNDHWVYLSKSGSRQQTNIQKHISDISKSGRTNEIKILKIWRELNQLDFPSIYLEYLLVKNILLYRSNGANDFAANAWYALNELAKDSGNPLFARVVDPANSNNILSDLLTTTEKNEIVAKAKVAASQQYWKNIVG
ncbi:MAG: hypothetical protein AAB725_00255 [Patescibacteria group bacterium]